jgi:hypothetical protein
MYMDYIVMPNLGFFKDALVNKMARKEQAQAIITEPKPALLFMPSPI